VGLSPILPLGDVNGRNDTEAFPIRWRDLFDLTSLARATVAKTDGTPYEGR
jgi:hypothetical protein